MYDGHVPEDMRYLPLLASQYRGQVDRIFFDEGSAVTSAREPSYSHSNKWRPGRWGVLHVARFELGAASGPLPDALQYNLVQKIFNNVRADWDWRRFGWRGGELPPRMLGLLGLPCRAHSDCPQAWNWCTMSVVGLEHNTNHGSVQRTTGDW